LFTNYDDIAFNLFYNGGSILKGVVNVLMFFLAMEYTRV